MKYYQERALYLWGFIRFQCARAPSDGLMNTCCPRPDASLNTSRYIHVQNLIFHLVSVSLTRSSAIADATAAMRRVS